MRERCAVPALQHARPGLSPCFRGALARGNAVGRCVTQPGSARPHHAGMTQPLRTARRRRSPDVWTLARRDYAAGDPAPRVCERYGLGVSTLRARARVERWRRSDEPDATPTAQQDRSRRQLDAAELAELACDHLNENLQAGRLRESQGWARLARDLYAMADMEGVILDLDETAVRCLNLLDQASHRIALPETVQDGPGETSETVPPLCRRDESDDSDAVPPDRLSSAGTGRNPRRAPASLSIRPAPPGSPPAEPGRPGPRAPAGPGNVAPPSPGGPRARLL